MGSGDASRTSPNQTPNACWMLPGSQLTRDNVRCREGKNPDRLLRSRSGNSVQLRMWTCSDSWEVGLEAAIPLKSA